MPEPLAGDRAVRWGIAATGRISSVFAEDLAVTPGCELVAVGSRTQQAADRFAAEHAIPRAYGSYEALAADAGVDVVYVGTVHTSHYAVTKACLEAGRAVLCEKPFTVDAARTEELVAVARELDTFLMEAMWMRCRPAFAELSSVLRSGEIGEVRSLRAALGFPADRDRAPRLFDPAQGGGALLDVGVYPVTLAYATLGAPTEITAVAHLEGGVDRTVAVTMRFANGALAQLGGTIEAEIDCSASFGGAAGRIDIDDRFHELETFSVRSGEDVRRVVLRSEGHGYVHEAAEVVRCLREGVGESPLVPLDDSVAIMRLLDECRAQVGLDYPEAAYR